MKQSVEVKVGGQTFRIRSDAGEPHIRAVAEYVTERLEEARESMGPVTGSPYKVALLAALNLADELLREREGRKEKNKRIEEQSRELLGYLDELAIRIEAAAEPGSTA